MLASARRLELSPSDTVVVAVSGGPDSTCLLDALVDIRERPGAGFGLHAAHLIHDFRGQEKYDDADFVQDICERSGLDLTVEEVDVAAYQRQQGVSSFEQAARDLRYEFLARVAKTTGAKYVAVAHTADDLAETVLLHIARGTGMHGLRGMDEVGAWPYPASGGGPEVWRPLLGVRRADTVEYCRQRGPGYRDDTTNYMEDFARNRVRMNLMPALAQQLNPRIVDAFGRLARTARDQLDFLEACVDEQWPAVAGGVPTQHGVVRLRRDKLAELHHALRALILRRAWVAATGDGKRLTEAHVQRIMAIAGGKASGKTVALPGGYVARAAANWLEILRPGLADDCPFPDPFGEFRITLPWGPIAVGVTKRGGWEVTARSVRLPAGASLDTGDGMQAYLAPHALSEGADVRTWEAGDRIQTLGMSGRRKLQDLFTDSGVPRDWRGRMPLVVTPSGIAWAVGLRIADWAAVETSPDGEADAVLMQFSCEPREAKNEDD